MFKTAALLATVLVVAGCEGAGMEGGNDTGLCETPIVVENSPGSCLWQLPAGLPCTGEHVLVNGNDVPADFVDLICNTGTLVIRDAQTCQAGVGGVVSVYTCAGSK